MITKTDSYFEELEKRYGKLSFGAALKAFREAEGKTQSDFAQELGFSIQNLCDIEKGRRIPSPARAAHIAKSLRLPEKALIELSLRDSLEREGLKYSVRLERSA
jgi:transcriptional regulator with XRE-family HTH domain